eukprot:CAMPEP_0202892920 /NCGR_PEP_ID=MMETSP1392-20130828/2590_1 /ASSEMBLY_ACC=CAM_ASM_000868 /TAXON_ID=225041 /ORGANISM="Chlamydomonas chlamydogama, Strain SAG 11-48b" /LENGTH=333 /DNA_ID=CAMNT_0049577055 /DNA_START=60 /DNA_END=1061 /DNA_ORIENTATION=-
MDLSSLVGTTSRNYTTPQLLRQLLDEAHRAVRSGNARVALLLVLQAQQALTRCHPASKSDSNSPRHVAPSDGVHIEGLAHSEVDDLARLFSEIRVEAERVLLASSSSSSSAQAAGTPNAPTQSTHTHGPHGPTSNLSTSSEHHACHMRGTPGHMAGSTGHTQPWTCQAPQMGSSSHQSMPVQQQQQQGFAWLGVPQIPSPLPSLHTLISSSQPVYDPRPHPHEPHAQWHTCMEHDMQAGPDDMMMHDMGGAAGSSTSLWTAGPAAAAAAAAGSGPHHLVAAAPAVLPLNPVSDRDQLAECAVRDGSSYVCHRCGGVVLLARRQQHEELWCHAM